MAHIHNQIRDRVATLVGAVPTFSGRVYKMRSFAIDSNKLPAAVVYTNRASSELITIGFKTLRGFLEVIIDLHIVGSSATIANSIDDASALVEDAIGADFTLNGLAKSCVLNSVAISISVEGEKPVASARLSYGVEYVTVISDLETPL